MRAVFDFPPDPDHPPERRTFLDPVDVLTARSLEEVLPALREVERASSSGLIAAGYVGYEAAPAFDPAMCVRPSGTLPLLCFGVFEPGPDALSADSPERGVVDPSVQSVLERLSAAPLELDRGRYDAAVERIRTAIAEGRSYQVNLTARRRTTWRRHPETERLYEALRSSQGGGYHAWIEGPGFSILSASPELFFHRRGDRLTTRPMKGTRPRGRWPEEDRARLEELRTSEKERAENRMIVDLLRNDLGRLADFGTVEVPRILDVERYRTVFQTTSTVTARVPRETSLTEVLTAIFPSGSVTGAPKISTMELIAELEASPREVYCGAVGFVDGSRGVTTFNVPIRTAWIDRPNRTISYAAGGGITWDSDASEEYMELLSKGAILTRRWPTFGFLETLRVESGNPIRLDRHLDRLHSSASHFDVALPEPGITAALEDALNGLREEGVHRLRLHVSSDGRVEVRSEPMPVGEPGPPPPVVVDDVPVDRNDPFLFHKTDHRVIYEEARTRHPDAFDVILRNREGEVTEFTRGNLVAEIDGRRLTPRRECGLLAGCFRQELLDQGEIEEAVLRPDDLRRADRLFFVNSVREWVEVALRPGATR